MLSYAYCTVHIIINCNMVESDISFILSQLLVLFHFPKLPPQGHNLLI